jgi:recombination protein RecA
MNKENLKDWSKYKDISSVLAQIDKDYGKGTVSLIGDKTIPEVDVISTGSLALDSALGIGGLPLGRTIESFGPESHGKTSLMLQLIAEAQKKEIVCAFIDAEHALSLELAANIGVDVDKMILNQPDYGEQGLDVVRRLIQSKLVNLIVIDSLASLVPKAEIDSEFEDQHMGLQARMMSKAMRVLTAEASKNNVCLVFINQLRETMGKFFNPEITPGGRALKFYASVRLEVKRTSFLKDGENVIGGKTKVTIVKNKLYPPYKSVEFDLIFGKGIDKYSEVTDLAIQYDIVNKSGSWFSFEEEKLGQGKSNVLEFLKSDESIFELIKSKVIDSLQNPEIINKEETVEDINLKELE